MKTVKPIKIKLDINLDFLSKIEETKVSTLINKTQSYTKGKYSPSATLKDNSQSYTRGDFSPSATLEGRSKS